MTNTIDSNLIPILRKEANDFQDRLKSSSNLKKKKEYPGLTRYIQTEFELKKKNQCPTRQIQREFESKRKKKNIPMIYMIDSNGI